MEDEDDRPKAQYRYPYGHCSFVAPSLVVPLSDAGAFSRHEALPRLSAGSRFNLGWFVFNPRTKVALSASHRSRSLL